MSDKIPYKQSRWFNIFLKLTLGAWLRIYFRIEFDNSEIKSLKPPFLAVGNHVSFWDPFILPLAIKEPVHFVVSDAHFRIKWLRYLLKLVGSIPKAKQVADSNTIRAILSIKKLNGVIALYPEGRRTWDGKPMPVIYTTAKLIKSLKIPVVSVIMNGAFLSRPRWAKSARRGKTKVKYRVMLSPEQIESMDAAQIFDFIVNSLHYNEYEWQKVNHIPFKGRNRAEHLNLFLYICPHCKTIGTLFSKKHRLICRECGYSVIYDELGYLSTDGPPYFHTPQEWSGWQDEFFRDCINDNKYNESIIPYFSDENITLQTGGRKGKLRDTAVGRLSLYHNRICFKPNGENEILFPLDTAAGPNIQNNAKFEFYYEKKLYRFYTPDAKIVSFYKYNRAIELIKERDNTLK